jgi:hypothetical protein
LSLYVLQIEIASVASLPRNDGKYFTPTLVLPPQGEEIEEFILYRQGGGDRFPLPPACVQARQTGGKDIGGERERQKRIDGLDESSPYIRRNEKRKR